MGVCSSGPMEDPSLEWANKVKNLNGQAGFDKETGRRNSGKDREDLGRGEEEAQGG